MTIGGYGRNSTLDRPSNSSGSSSRRGGGVGVRRLCLTWRAFDFRERIEPAHVLTFFCFLLLFLEAGLRSVEASFEVSTVTSGWHPSGCADAAVLACESDDPALTGLGRVGELAPTKGSSPKNDHRLGVLVGLGVDGATALSEAGGSCMRCGIELRLRGEGSVESVPWML